MLYSEDRSDELKESKPANMGQPKSHIIKNDNSGNRFTKVIVNRKSKITLKISLRARIRAFH